MQITSLLTQLLASSSLTGGLQCSLSAGPGPYMPLLGLEMSLGKGFMDPELLGCSTNVGPLQLGLAIEIQKLKALKELQR